MKKTVNLTARRPRARANVNGGSREVKRGQYCTPKWIADLVGRWDLDPFSNPRSLIIATERCMLEDGGDGFGDRKTPGSYRVGSGPVQVATKNTRTWIQPDYLFVDEAIAHYGHTRFCALLRFDPSTQWFRRLYRLTNLVCVPRERLDFEPPPGVPVSSNPFPHALFYAREQDATDAVLRRCIAWRTR